MIRKSDRQDKVIATSHG